MIIRISDEQLPTLLQRFENLSDEDSTAEPQQKLKQEEGQEQEQKSSNLVNDWENRYTQYMANNGQKHELKVLQGFYKESQQTNKLKDSIDVLPLQLFLKQARN